MATEKTLQFVLVQLNLMYASQSDKLSEQQLMLRNQMYAKHLSDIDDDLLTQAAEQIIMESSWFPTVAQIREKAHAILRASEGGQIDPHEAFGIVMDMARTKGRDLDEEGRRKWLGHRLPKRAVDLCLHCIKSFGWANLCNHDTDKLDTPRAQWRTTFLAIQQRQDDFAKLSPATKDYIAKLADGFRADRPRLDTRTQDDDSEEVF